MRDPDQPIELVSAIENGDFDRAHVILSDEVRLMDRDKKYTRPVGALQVTALQMAAWQGRLDLLDRLCEKGANVNDTDKIGRSALYHAADNGNPDVVRWILQRGGSVNAKVGIHSCAKGMPHPMSLTKCCSVGKKLPLPVCWGRTPLHQAVKNNHADAVRILVEDGGADVNAKDERMITPLLLAGSTVDRDNRGQLIKFVEIVRILVGGQASINVFHLDTGTTALHHAAMLGSAEATEILLSNGAWPMFKCKSSGRVPLHMAAAAGSVKTLTVLLEAMQAHDIDTRDQLNRTALHQAAYQGHRECVRILVNHGGNLAAMTKTGVTVIDAIFAHIPWPMAFLTDMLDSCVRAVNNSPLAKDENIIVDLRILAPKNQMQMAVVTAIIVAASGIAQLAIILQHPLVETFLRLKWARLRILFFVLLFVHFVCVIFLSVYGLMLVRDDPECVAIRRILLASSCILLFHNVVQVSLEPKYYLKQLETWLSFVCAALSLIVSVAGEFLVRCEDLESGDCWMLHIISVAILLSWMQMMLLIGRFPMCGCYALMFSAVLKNILKVLLVFGCLIVGFALSFSVLFYRNQQFGDFWMSLVRTVVMMTGEYEYEDLLRSADKHDDKVAAFLPITSRIVFLVFVMLASIVLINLMIGLAVNDIQALEKEGRVRRLLKQAEFVAHLERVTSHRVFRGNWLHARLRALLHSRRDIPTRIMLTTRANYFPHMDVDGQRAVCADLIEPLLQLAKRNDDGNSTDKNMWDTKLSAIMTRLEDQIRELKAYYRSLVIRKFFVSE